MYGLIMENLSQYVMHYYGDAKWEEIRRVAKVDHNTFSTHHVYPDNYIPKLTAKACKILGVTEKDFLNGMGVYFVAFLGQYGYDRVLNVLGRNMRDFLNGLDNLHEYLKFSYPRMKAPSFFCENESASGLTLHYRSTRRGFLWYTIGQIREVGSHFYNTEVKIEIIKEETVFDSLHVMMLLTFDNRAFQLDQSKKIQKVEKFMLPIKSQIFLEIFPFCVVFDQSLMIRTIGNSLTTILPNIIGKKLLDVFDITRPLIEYSWRSIQSHTNNIFELTSVEPIVKEVLDVIRKDSASGQLTGRRMDKDDDEDDEILLEDKLLHLKGQMMFMEEWKSMAYLGTPVMRDLDAMIHTGLYINDLSMHDFSRDMVLAGQQQSSELKLALDQELHKTKQLEDSMRKLDVEMKRTDELLYQMIPKQVADRLRKGEAAMATCQFFDSVTILFSDVVTFTEICSRISPMQVVSMLNSMYSLFDQLTEKHGVYKVETIGDAYMVVSGAPDEDAQHAEKICQMALDMVLVIGDLKDPSTGHSIRIRVGVHTGAVVAGVVGLRMPRYCLFGDAVNTASRMESTSEALKIHISQNTTEGLKQDEWDIAERGTVTVKGKGDMKTYWLNSRHNKTHSMAAYVGHIANDVSAPDPTQQASAPPQLASLLPANKPSKSPDIDPSDIRRERSATQDAGEGSLDAESPVTMESISRFTPPASPSVSETSQAFSDPVITYTEPLGKDNTETQVVAVTATSPSTGVSSCKRHRQQPSSREGPLQAWTAEQHLSRPQQHQHQHLGVGSRVCQNCHYSQVKQLSELVQQQQVLLKEATLRTTSLYPLLPQQPTNLGYYLQHPHIRSQACNLL